MKAKTYGYSRKRDLPADGGKAKICPRCNDWFSQRPRERICQGCRPYYQQARMVSRKRSVKAANVQVTSVVGGTYSDVLHLTFKPGVPLWHILALEAAAVQRWSYR